MTAWRLVYSKEAKKLAGSGLKRTAQTLLDMIAHDPFATPPRYQARG